MKQVHKIIKVMLDFIVSTKNVIFSDLTHMTHTKSVLFLD